ncbi:Putative DNA-binding domain-containing protein [Marivirga sericea]|uniref:Putative DNA-binding domain-containing protein n=1 Tax=Marivirga sericea TaxID=1028 RepID=A0A1X7IIF3_9BACT|nr:ATP-binding protein [Marivirga sericea]SMG14211.1 Putative DNA-binding domain-containing protein [Marivirga sericea]
MIAIKESFAKILEQPDRVAFRDLMKSNFGELNYIDFKAEWIDSDKTARHILAMANSGGGIIVLGVSEEDGEIEPRGLNKIKDKADVTNSLNKFLPNNLEYEILDFTYKESEYDKLKGLKFQLILITDLPRYIPFLSRSESSTIKKDQIYIRRGTQSIQANYEELQKLFNRRIESEYDSTSEKELEEHLAQLKTLYKQIKKHFNISTIDIPEDELKEIFEEQEAFRSKNKNYPDEGFDEFVLKLITIKKELIISQIKK